MNEEFKAPAFVASLLRSFYELYLLDDALQVAAAFRIVKRAELGRVLALVGVRLEHRARAWWKRKTRIKKGE